ncbi:MAG: aminotransferase class I/II-fold pyridoxal phosphate-dependent enzyme, partial [Blastochloris sp.]|nr:aminotransferase class I/II-fold pyridoxal phosphate-dependent enzyme [Blastochloris sp.]
DLEKIRRAIRPNNLHFPPTRLICLENTHGGAMGAPVPKDYIADVAQIARAHGLKLHIDGARIFNAATALNTPVDQLVADADSVSFCLSKGLCAPVGSIVVGSSEFIGRVRKYRKMLGGQLRQAGVLAAAGLVSLREMTKRLHEDHANARLLAEGLAQMPYIEIDVERVKTNMVFFALTPDTPVTADELAARLKAEYGILARPYSIADRTFRMVTHYYITRESVEQTLAAMRAILDPAAMRVAGD